MLTHTASSLFLTVEQRAALHCYKSTFDVFLSIVLDDALMPSVLPLVKREDITPMEVSSNLQSNVFKVKLLFFTSKTILNSNILFRLFKLILQHHFGFTFKKNPCCLLLKSIHSERHYTCDFV